MQSEDIRGIIKHLRNENLLSQSRREATLLYKCTERIKSGNIVELGTRTGGSLLVIIKAFLNAQSKAHLYSLDISAECIAKAKQTCSRFNAPQSHYTLINANSQHYHWDRGPIAMLFIDAEHSVDGLSNDILTWSRHVKGTILVHDYAHGQKHASHSIYSQIREAVDQNLLTQNWRLTEIKGRMAKFKKTTPKAPTIQAKSKPAPTPKPKVKKQKRKKKETTQKKNSQKALLSAKGIYIRQKKR